jgi:hypothetical protein
MTWWLVHALMGRKADRSAAPPCFRNASGHTRRINTLERHQRANEHRNSINELRAKSLAEPSSIRTYIFINLLLDTRNPKR